MSLATRILEHPEARFGAGAMLVAAFADALPQPDFRRAGHSVEQWREAVANIERDTGAQPEEVIYHLANLAYTSTRAARLPRTPFMRAVRRRRDVVAAVRSLPGWDEIEALPGQLAPYDGLAYEVLQRRMGDAIDAFTTRTGAPPIVLGAALAMRRRGAAAV